MLLTAQSTVGIHLRSLMLSSRPFHWHPMLVLDGVQQRSLKFKLFGTLHGSGRCRRRGDTPNKLNARYPTKVPLHCTAAKVYDSEG
jgi:hypothetical protein